MGERGSRALRARAVFLDRDGVLDDPVVRPESGGRPEAPHDPAAVRLAPGAADGVRALRAAGWLLIGVSNQPGAAKRQTTLESLRAVHERVVELLGVELDGWEYCLHHPDGEHPLLGGACLCRKPAPGMLIEAAFKHAIDLEASWMIGDSDSDVAAGAAVGARTLLVEHPGSAHRRFGAAEPTAVATDLGKAAALVGQARW